MSNDMKRNTVKRKFETKLKLPGVFTRKACEPPRKKVVWWNLNFLTIIKCFLHFKFSGKMKNWLPFMISVQQVRVFTPHITIKAFTRSFHQKKCRSMIFRLLHLYVPIKIKNSIKEFFGWFKSLLLSSHPTWTSPITFIQWFTPHCAVTNPCNFILFYILIGGEDSLVFRSQLLGFLGLSQKTCEKFAWSGEREGEQDCVNWSESSEWELRWCGEIESIWRGVYGNSCCHFFRHSAGVIKVPWNWFLCC